jgi:prepilin peptidase CpaA
MTLSRAIKDMLRERSSLPLRHGWDTRESLAQWIRVAILITFPLLMIGAGIGDCLTYKIPNWLVGLIGLAVLSGCLVCRHAGCRDRLASGCSCDCIDWLASSCSALASSVAAMPSCSPAVASLWIGMSPLLPFLIFVALSGGVLALVMKFWWLVRLNADVFKLDKLAKRLKASIDLPYGVAIAGGALIAFPDSWIYQAIEGPKIF